MLQQLGYAYALSPTSQVARLAQRHTVVRQKFAIGHKGPQRANRDCPGPLPKTPETYEIAQKLRFGGVWGETGTSKHVLDTIQSIWVAGFPEIWVWGSISKQNHVFQGSQNPGRRSTSCLRRARILEKWGPQDVGPPLKGK